MSRVGKKPIPVPSDVTVKIHDRDIKIKGQLGELEHTLPSDIDASLEDKTLTVTRKSDDRIQRSLHGLTRSLIANMIEGVSKGFEKTLVLEGIGYRVQAKGDTLILSLGFSHLVNYSVPKGISAKIDRNKVVIRGFDKQLVGQTAAEIRAFRPVEPYKGKGIKYLDEHVRRKVGKVGT